MTQQTKTRSIKEINAEFEKVFTNSNLPKTQRSLRECGTDDFTQFDSFKLNLQGNKTFVLVKFAKSFDPSKQMEYKQKSLIFEDKLRDLHLSYLNLEIQEAINPNSPSIGYLIWDEYTDTEDVLLQALSDWQTKYENMTAIIFKHKG